MKCDTSIILVALAFLLFPWGLKAQGKSDRVIEMHKNVTLVVTAIPADMPEELRGEYRRFLPMLEEVLKAITAEESPECALTIQVTAGVKEIGSARVKRAFARVTAYRHNSNREFVARLFLHSFATDGPVSKEEIEDFLQQRILSVAKCQPKVTQADPPPGLSSPRSN